MSRTATKADALTDFGWPTCAICGTPVEQVSWSRDALSDRVILVAQCHGETERVVVDAAVLEAAHAGAEIKFGTAFARKREPRN